LYIKHNIYIHVIIMFVQSFTTTTAWSIVNNTAITAWYNVYKHAVYI
jgi:hypothetical protein